MYLILIFLAAFFYAVHEVVDNHFSISVFNKKNPAFWDGQQSWKTAKRIFNYPVDAKHLASSGMIVMMCLSTCIAQFSQFQIKFLNWWEQLIACGIIWIIVFNTFFNHILVAKK